MFNQLDKTMPFLNKEQVDTLSLEQAQRALKLLTQSYKLDAPLQEYMTPELWDCVDQICDTLLYLEDRIKYIQMIDHLDTIRHGEKSVKKLPVYVDAHPTGNLQQGDEGYDANWDEPVIAI